MYMGIQQNKSTIVERGAFFHWPLPTGSTEQKG